MRRHFCAAVAPRPARPRTGSTPATALLGDARAEIDAQELGVAAGYDLHPQSKRQSAVTTCPTRKVCSTPCSTTAFMPKVTAPCMRSLLR
jgi:hypothetical protein